MIAILLCAGFGTRMGSLTNDQPKALLPVAGRPVIDYLMDQLVGLPRLEGVHLVSNGRFFAHFARWRGQMKPVFDAHGLALTLYDDGVQKADGRLGAVGDLAFILERINEAGIRPGGALVAAGDNILRFPLSPIWNVFLERQIDLILALYESDRDRLRRSGVPVLDNPSPQVGELVRVVDIFEKPVEPPGPWLCPPFYFLTADALALVPVYLAEVAADGNGPLNSHTIPHRVDAIGHFVSFLVRRTLVYAMLVQGERLDIGNLEDYRQADWLLCREPVLISQ